jgi:acyl carrier protein
MKDEIENRIKDTMSIVFEVSAHEINEDTSPDTIDKWDSLKHMNLIVALEEEFGVVFDDNEIVELITYPLIISILFEKIK